MSKWIKNVPKDDGLYWCKCYTGSKCRLTIAQVTSLKKTEVIKGVSKIKTFRVVDVWKCGSFTFMDGQEASARKLFGFVKTFFHDKKIIPPL